MFVGQGRTFRIVNPTTRTALRDEEKAKVGAQNLSLTSLFDEGVV